MCLLSAYLQKPTLHSVVSVLRRDLGGRRKGCVARSASGGVRVRVPARAPVIQRLACTQTSIKVGIVVISDGSALRCSRLLRGAKGCGRVTWMCVESRYNPTLRPMTCLTYVTRTLY